MIKKKGGTDNSGGHTEGQENFRLGDPMYPSWRPVPYQSINGTRGNRIAPGHDTVLAGLVRWV